MSAPVTPVKTIRKRLPEHLKCRVCGESVTVQGGLYRIFGGKVKTRDIQIMLEKLLDCSLSESTGSSVLCKKCFRKAERYENTLDEMIKLKKSHRTNCEEWRSENIRRKRCINSPGRDAKRISTPQGIQQVKRSLLPLPANSTTSALKVISNENTVLSTSKTFSLEVLLNCMFLFSHNYCDMFKLIQYLLFSNITILIRTFLF